MHATIRKLSFIPATALALAASAYAAMAATAPPAAKAPAAASLADRKPDVVVPSRPETVVRGVLSYDLQPIAHVKPGQIVKINTVSHGGLQDPVAIFGAAGIPKKDVLQDAIDISAATKAGKFGAGAGGGGHVLTGPIYIDGAEPGDMLEVRILKVTPRTYYGTNGVGPGGVAAGVLTKSDSKVIKFDVKKNVMFIAPGVVSRMGPFMGIMAVEPPPEMGKISSRAPGAYGGNMDFRRLTAGSTLYLPVFNKGALFTTGDSHAGQGDGEISGNANEASMAPTLQFILHKGEGKDMAYPWAEDAKNYYVMGMDHDLGKASSVAAVQTVNWLHEHEGISLEDAYHLCSVGVDFAIAESVDLNLTVYSTIPKSYFEKKTPYWSKS